MKDFVNRILGAKYTGYVALVLALIIVIVAIYLISVQFKDTRDVSIDLAEKPDVAIENASENTSTNDNKEVKENEEAKKEEKVSNEENQKVEFASELNILLKGSKVGSAYRSSGVDGSFEKIQAGLSNKEKASVTTDSVISLDVSTLNKTTIDSIKEIDSSIYNKDGNVIFNPKLANKYDRISLAVDELEESEEYYVYIAITLTDSSKVEYIFKF